MYSKNSYCSCGIVALRTRISYSFVYNFNTYLKICCCSCSIVALRAKQGYLTPLCILSTCFFRSCSVVEVIFTLRTWISYSFMLTFNMNLQMTCSSCKQQVYSLQYQIFQYSIHLNINNTFLVHIN